MSGRLVVLDRSGRAGKRFPLASGLATLGRGAACDIRVLLPAVSQHHATITVHANQTVVRNVGSGATLVNGAAVSVHALKHGDELSLGGRRLRWEYDRPPRARTDLPPVPALPTASGAEAGPARAARRGTLAAAPRAPDRDLQLALELRHRASMPASSAGGKQVAIVQPQRRDTNHLNDSSAMPRSAEKRARSSAAAPPASPAPPAPASPAPAPATAQQPASARLHTPTKATLWIESRRGRARAASMRHATPLRLAVLRRAVTPRPPRPARPSRPRHTHSHSPAVTKIQAPTVIDHTKQAAIMLMTGHTPKSKQPSPRRATPGFVAKRSPRASKTPRASRTPRGSATPRSPRQTPDAGSARRASKRSEGNQSVSILEITDSEAGSMRRSRRSPATPATPTTPATPATPETPALPSPKKSALKDPRGRSRKTDSIKFDLSNLDSRDSMFTADDATASVLTVSDATRGRSQRFDTSEEDMTLRYSSSPSPSPSPRRALHSRSSRMLERSLGAALPPPAPSPARASPAEPPAEPARKSSRGSLIVQNALDVSDATEASFSRHSRRSAGSASAASPRARRALEAYSIVDLMSSGSDASALSEYGSAGSGTPRPSARSTPRSKPATPTHRPTFNVTPEHVSQPARTSMRVSRTARSRSRLADASAESPGPLAPGSSGSRRSSRRARPPSSGEVTPDQPRRSPSPAGTPVLSIRSLLDATLSPPAEPARRSAADRRRTFAAGPPPAAHTRPPRARSLGGEVTPTGTVLLAPEAVKNKHSSAKKSQSRRSIIDNLEDSTFVKHLFNSPVKRKLSQSMSEFSRRLDDGDASPPRSASVGAAISPAAFVSPLSPRTPRTPRTPDLRGVARSLRTPRARRSIHNDLTDVAGVKTIFAKSPENRLSDVRGVREMFTEAPRDDLRRVSGVRSLFRSGTKPRNDLTDVRGVRNLFKRGSPRNELNVSGVKDALRIRSPKNDLRDVRGVRRLYRVSRKRTSPDLSGVARLLDDEPAPAEALFDQLVGRPVIKATYSKSFVAPARKPASRRRSASLGAVAPDNVEEWLQEELRKRTTARGNRELAKLATDTVEGVSPLRQSRGRSAAALYSARKLPIKKRSLVTASADSTRLADRSGASPRLPLKKRALVHSTPLKGRRAAPAPARVSPIPSPGDSIIPEDEQLGSTIIPPESPKDKPQRERKTRTTNIEQENVDVKPSPKKTRARVVKEQTSRVRGTRARAAAAPPSEAKSNTRGKKAAVASKPPPAAKTAKTPPVQSPAASPAPRRARARAAPQPPATKARRASLLLPKPSPKLRPARSRAAAKPSPAPVKPARAAAKTKSTAESPVAPKVKRSTRKAPEPEAPRSGRKRKAAEPEPKPGKVVKQASDPGPKLGRRAVASPAAPTPPKPAKRGRKAAPSPQPQGSATEPKAKRGRKTAAIQEPAVVEPTAPRGKRARAAPPAPASPPAPARRRKAAASPPAPASRRKAAPAPASPAAPVSRRKAAPTPPAPASRRGAAAPSPPAAAPRSRARSAKRGADVSPPKREKKTTRGTKAAAAVEEVAESATRGRKRKNVATAAEKAKEPSPKKPRERARNRAAAAAASPPAPRRTRRR